MASRRITQQAEATTRTPRTGAANGPGAAGGRRRRVTLADVAKVAGVAVPTVSGILNDRADCYASQATRDRVIEAARDLGYRPNQAARALSGKPTATVGLVTGGFDVEVTSLKLSGFEAAARESGHVAVTACHQNQPELEDRAIRWLMDRCVDGLAVYPTEEGDHTELRRLVDQGFPVVTFDAEGRVDFMTDDVSVDVFAGGQLLGQHLLEIGRKRVAIANSRQTCYITSRKREGILAAYKAAGVSEPVCMDVDLSEHAVRHWVTDDLSHVCDFLREHKGEFDAVAGVGDDLALAAMRYAVEEGLSIPEDMAIIGYDGVALASMLPIPLTTVWHDSVHVGRLAFELLGQRLSSDETPTEFLRHRIPPQIHVRASTVGRQKV